ncbi:MAG: hypothetical protein Ct9H90mP5_04760 [Acidimicrobiaceae bacterium]|nr:MAG: hypothetical protein Ct9H90mP5_04760 [Acidimicrobiaceae bacterium]
MALNLSLNQLAGKRPKVNANANRYTNTVLFIAKGVPSNAKSGHSKRWLTGGNSSARIFTFNTAPNLDSFYVLSFSRGFKPGYLRVAETSVFPKSKDLNVKKLIRGNGMISNHV